MWIILILLVLAAGAAYFYLEKKKQKKDREVLKPAPWEGPDKMEGLAATKPKPVESKPEPIKQPAKPKPPAAIKTPVKRAPRPQKPAPEGWYRHANGQIYRNIDPKALWNPAVARTTKRIDFALMDGGLLPEQDLGNVRLDRLAYSAFPLPDVSFAVDIGPTTLLNTSVVYLCDKTGKVIDFTISAIGSNLSEGMLTHNKGDIEGGPYIVQASDGISAASQFSRPNPARRKR